MDAVPTFGAKKKPTRSKGIAAQKIAAMTKGSDKLAKAAEEQAAKVRRICGLFVNSNIVDYILCRDIMITIH